MTRPLERPRFRELPEAVEIAEAIARIAGPPADSERVLGRSLVSLRTGHSAAAKLIERETHPLYRREDTLKYLPKPARARMGALCPIDIQGNPGAEAFRSAIAQAVLAVVLKDEADGLTATAILKLRDYAGYERDLTRLFRQLERVTRRI